ncbi:MAG TPA: tetratricopeptide repeat protein [Gemmataceae bacterium]|nr:tetratricopeptide repeat protein [Gemmataceae bacterium]
MSEIISCPACQRRLQLPRDFQGEVAQCPSCQTQFSMESARTVISPAAAATASPLPDDLPPFAEAATEEDAAGERDGSAARWQTRPPRRLGSADSTAKQSARKPWAILLAVLGTIALVLGIGVVSIGLLVWRPWAAKRNTPIHVQEDDEERRQEIRAAFANRKPLAEKEIAQELDPLFDELGDALRAANANQITALFDCARMVDECAGLKALPLQLRKQRREFEQGIRLGIGRSLAQRAQFLRWTTSEIRNVKKLNNDEAVVIVRHKHPNEASLKMRWWVTRRDGPWKIYDMEDLDMGTRLSVAMVALVGQGLNNITTIGTAVKTINEALEAVALRQDADSAEKKLKQVAGVKLPPQMEAMRFLVTGIVHLQRERAAEALEALETAGRYQPDMPILDYLKGDALNRLGQYAKAQKHLEAYRDLLGDDGAVCRELGECLRGQGRFPEAAKAYRTALDLNPKDAGAYQGFLRSLGGDANKDDVGPRFAKLDNLQENFDIFAANCEEREFPELLEPLVLAMKRIDPAYAPVDFYLALVKARTRKAEEAVTWFKSALAKQTDAKKRLEYGKQFLQVMVSIGKGAEAYAVVPDSGEAFRVVAAEALKRYQLDQLKQLIAAHRKKHVDDPLLDLYQAALHVREGRYRLADKTFAAALAKPRDKDTLLSFRELRVLARYHSGQMLAAYREIGPRQDTFRQLAALCFNEDDDDSLQTLLDAHAKSDPQSSDLLRFRYRLKIRQNQTPEGVALFKASLAKRLSDEERAERVSEFLTDMTRAGKPLEGYQAAPDAKKAFRTVAGDLLEQGHWEELRRLVEAHRKRHAEDSWLAYYQGEIHGEEQAWDKAAQVLGAGMKQAPKEVRASLRRQFVYAMYKAGRGLSSYAEAESPNENFTQLADLLAADKKGAELETLIQTHRRQVGDSPDLIYQESRAKLLLKKPAEAIALLHKAHQRQKEEFRRKSYVNRFLFDMEEAGQVLEGYRAAPDKIAAFETLAPRLIYQKKDKELAALLQEYRKGHENDPFYRFYQGELYLLRGDAKQAEPHFAAALAKKTPQTQWRFRNGLFRARIKAGKAADTYREIEPGTTTFESLAYLCVQDKDATQLQALIAVHRQAHPDDPNLPAWDLEVRWLKQDYDEALKLLAEHHDDVFELSRWRWKANDYQVRCLVKLKQSEEAIRAAEDAVKSQYADRTLLVLAHASAGNIQQAIATVEKSRSRTYLLRNCYRDEDLGPILRSEPFKGFREKFPEPKDRPGRGDSDD